MLDIFSSNPAFTVSSLTMALNRFPFVPGKIGTLGLFTPKRLTTTSTNVEVKSGRLALVPSQPRGAPPAQNVDDRRQLVPFLVPHFPLSDTLMADEIQGVRAFGTEDQLEAITSRVDDKLESMGRKQDVTLEFLRLGAVKGLVVTRVNPLNGAPEVAVDMRAAFGLPAKALAAPGPGGVPIPYDMDWPLLWDPAGGAATLPDYELLAMQGELTALSLELVRLIANRLGADSFTSIHGIAGSRFFDEFYKHPEIRSTYVGQPEASRLRDPQWMRAIYFRELVIEEYRGQIGGIPFVEPDMCHFFPVGVPDLFVEAYAPADYIEAVNTVALPRYAKQEVIPFGKGIMIETQQNVLPICSLPDTLITVRLSNRPPLP